MSRRTGTGHVETVIPRAWSFQSRLWLACVIVWSGPCWGGEAVAAQDEVKPLERVEVDGSGGDKLTREVAAGKITLGRTWLTRSNALTVRDVLQRDPAVTVSASGRIGLQGLVGYTQVLLDGDLPPRGLDPLDLPPSQIDRIEIIRGATAETGLTAIAGTVNVIRRKQKSRLPLEWSSQLRGPQSDHSARFSAQATWRDEQGGSAGFTVNAHRQRPDGAIVQSGWFGPPEGDPDWLEQTRTSGRNDSLSVSPRASWRLNNSDSLSVNAHFISALYEQSRRSQRQGNIGGDFPQFTTHVWSWVTSPSLEGKVEWERQLESGGRWLSRWSQSWTEEGMSTSGMTEGKTGAVQQLRNSDERSRRSTEMRVQRLGWVLGEHKLQWGAQWKRESVNQRQHIEIAGDPSFLDEFFSPEASSRNDEASIWAEDEWDWSEVISVNFGLRYERREGLFHGMVQPIRRRLNLLAPSVNFSWALDEALKHNLSVGVSRGFKMPLAMRLNPRPIINPASPCSSPEACGTNRPDAPDRAGNPTLQPETSWGLDVNLDSTLRGQSTTSIGISMRQLDQVVLNSTSLEQVPWSWQARWVERPRNEGRAWSRGLTLGAHLVAADWLDAPAPTLEVSGSLQWAWSEIRQVVGPNNRLADQSPLTAKFGVKYRWKRWPLDIHSDLIWHQANRWRNAAGSSEWQNSRLAWSASGTWKTSSKSQISIHGNQLLRSTQSSLTEWSGVDFSTLNLHRPRSSLTLTWSSSL